MTITKLKEKYEDIFDLLVRKASQEARLATHGVPDRQWAYTKAEAEFRDRMREMGELL